MSFTPRYTNLVALCDEATTRFRSSPLFGTRIDGSWRWTTFGEFRELVAQARAGLASLGVERGDRVAVISNNRLEWAVGAHATYGMGALYAPMYEAQLDKEWAYILRDSGAKVCFTANATIEKRVKELQADLPALEHIIAFGAAWDALLEKGKQQPVEPADVKDDDVAALIYTSGTTGKPKGVMLTHFNIAANISALDKVAPVHEGDRSLAFLPWAHVFGGCVELNAIIALGCSTAICDDTRNLIDYLPEVRPTMLFAVPRIWNRIYDGVRKQVASRPAIVQRIFETALEARSKQKREQTLSLRERISLAIAQRVIFAKVLAGLGGRLRFAFSGAAALSSEVAEFIDNLGISVYEGYGMTESSGTTTTNLPGARRIGSVGKPAPGIDVKLDLDVPGTDEGEGEVLIYGTGVMSGYYNQPEATEQTMTADGGLRTGDLGRIDEDGFLFITGRVKELYKLENGKYVAPAPLEEQIQLSPYITQCVVYGEDKPHNVALIVPDMVSLREWARQQGVPEDSEALLADPQTRALIREEIEKHSRGFKGYESIRDFVLEAEELTPQNDMLTPTLKIKRRNVYKNYGQQLTALY